MVLTKQFKLFVKSEEIKKEKKMIKPPNSVAILREKKVD